MEIANGIKSYMYEQLWKFCAGPKVDIPKIGEQVYYFPQGHIELIEDAGKEKLNQIESISGLPSKFQCRVIDTQLKVEKDDDVYAQITLIPNKTEVVIQNQNNHHDRPMVNSFTKVLTDTDIHGVFCVPMRDASECFPPLDMTKDSPTQELIAKDLHGNEWKFKHGFESSLGHHFLTAEWSTFVAAKKVVAGDAVVILSSRGEKRELRIGIRRAKHQHRNIVPSLISNETMRHGVIASASHAFHNSSMFTVIYNPRSSHFVVSYNKFMDAINKKFDVGLSFSICCEANDLCERRYSGKIIGVNNFSPVWKNSEWKSLQVQWDESAPYPGCDKISPWEIEHLTSSSNVFNQE